MGTSRTTVLLSKVERTMKLRYDMTVRLEIFVCDNKRYQDSGYMGLSSRRIKLNYKVNRNFIAT